MHGFVHLLSCLAFAFSVRLWRIYFSLALKIRSVKVNLKFMFALHGLPALYSVSISIVSLSINWLRRTRVLFMLIQVFYTLSFHFQCNKCCADTVFSFRLLARCTCVCVFFFVVQVVLISVFNGYIIQFHLHKSTLSLQGNHIRLFFGFFFLWFALETFKVISLLNGTLFSHSIAQAIIWHMK